MSTDLLCGQHAVIEAIRAGRRRVHEVLVTRERRDEIAAVMQSNDIPVHEVAAGALRQLTNVEKHQGIAARVDPFSYTPVEKLLADACRDPTGAFLVILDQVQDPQNVGSIIRTAHNCGVHGVILPKDNAASIGPTVCRAAAGATEYTPIAQVTNIVQVMKRLKLKNIWLIGGEGGLERGLYQYRFEGHHAILLGAEGKGIRRLVREECDALVSIPLQGHIGSYNVAAAAAIILGEVLRQRIVQKSLKTP